jgi:uncharacterized membrane protein YbhN (UPF0104 family)
VTAKRLLILLFGLALGAAFLWFAVSRVDIPGVRIVLGRVEVAPTLIVIIAGAMFLMFKTWRWRRILGAHTGMSSGSAFRAVAIGSAANYVLPHLGEFFRIWATGDRPGVTRTSVMATIGLERMLDIAAICLIGIALTTLEPETSGMRHALDLLAIASGLGFVLLVIGLRRPEAFLRVAERFTALLGTKFSARAIPLLRGALSGVANFIKPGEFIRLLSLSFLQWACIAVCVAASLSAVGLAITLGSSVAVLVALVVGLILPSGPGYAGTTQLAFVLALEPLGYSGESALAASLVYNATIVGVIVVIALLCFGAPTALRIWKNRHGAASA